MLIVLGLVLGSFVNALVWRLHEQEKRIESAQKVSEKRERELSIARGRSMCPHCHHPLAAKDLVPVFSWLSLKGKCRYCKKPIGWQYPLVELATAVLLVVSYLWWPYAWNTEGVIVFCFWVVFVTGFMALTVYDLKWLLLPNRIVYPLIGLALGQVLLQTIVFGDGWLRLLTAILGAGVVAGLFYLLFQLSAGKWIGGGDVKLGVVLGLLAGDPVNALLLIFLASTLGTIVSLPLLLRGARRNMVIPFGPFLIAATFVTVLFGNQIVEWYTGLYLR
jgi:prepilin signal peptidase PulO-like enzyme (type II secretory pathway)